jgi:hypothetical protein
LIFGVQSASSPSAFDLFGIGAVRASQKAWKKVYSSQMKTHILAGLICLNALLMLPGYSAVVMTQYSAPAAFSSAIAPSPVTDDYSSLVTMYSVPVGGYSLNPSYSVLGGTGTIQNDAGLYLVNATPSAGFGFGDGSPMLTPDTTSGTGTTFSFSGAYTAIGYGIFGDAAQGFPASIAGTLADSNGGIHAFSVTVPASTNAAPTSGFLGFTISGDGASIASISYGIIGGLGFGDMIAGTAIPEPGSAAMLAFAGIGFVAYRRRARKA